MEFDPLGLKISLCSLSHVASFNNVAELLYIGVGNNGYNSLESKQRLPSFDGVHTPMGPNQIRSPWKHIHYTVYFKLLRWSLGQEAIKLALASCHDFFERHDPGLCDQ